MDALLKMFGINADDVQKAQTAAVELIAKIDLIAVQNRKILDNQDLIIKHLGIDEDGNE